MMDKVYKSVNRKLRFLKSIYKNEIVFIAQSCSEDSQSQSEKFIYTLCASVPSWCKSITFFSVKVF